MALFDYDKEAFEPSIISAHGLKREVPRKTGGGGNAAGRAAQKQKNKQVLQQVTTNIYNYGAGGNASTPEIELRVEKFNNIQIDSGETLEILAKKGAGLLHGLEVVVDNPYSAVYLEIDGYRNTTDGIGETPAELLLNNRTTRVDGQFYVKTKASDGTYTMLYTPQKPEPYEEQLRIMVSNRIRTSRDVYGMSLNYTSRGGIPTPIKTDFMGGGNFAHSGLQEASLQTIANAVAKPIGSTTYAVDDVYNQAVYDSNSLTLGTGHPYQGQAGKPSFTKNLQFDTSLGAVEFFTAGTTGQDGANSVSGPALLGAGNFPGTPSSPSHQNIAIYKDDSKDFDEQPTWDEMIIAGNVRVNVGGGIAADAQTTIPVDTTDATLHFDVGDLVLDNTGAIVGTVQSVTATLITLLAKNIVELADDEYLFKRQPTFPKVGERLFFRNKGTLYFPGVVKGIFKYNRAADTGDTGWARDNENTETKNANFGNASGAYCFQVSPGLRSIPSVYSKTTDTSTDTISFGTVSTAADDNPKILVKGLFIKRQTVVGSES